MKYRMEEPSESPASRVHRGEGVYQWRKHEARGHTEISSWDRFAGSLGRNGKTYDTQGAFAGDILVSEGNRT